MLSDFHGSGWDTWKSAPLKCKSRAIHDDIIKWKHFPHHWPILRGIHQWPVDSPHKHKGQCRGALMFSLTFAWTNGWASNWDACDLRCHLDHYVVTVMGSKIKDGICFIYVQLQRINSYICVVTAIYSTKWTYRSCRCSNIKRTLWWEL